jgi:mRNA interferase MazF
VICDTWDIVVVPFPFADRAGTKERPALVLSRESFNQGAGHTLLAMITTRAHSPWPGDTLITDRATTGLPVPCTVRLKLFTLDNRLVLRKLGRLSLPDEIALKSQLTDMLPHLEQLPHHAIAGRNESAGSFEEHLLAIPKDPDDSAGDEPPIALAFRDDEMGHGHRS